MTYCKEAFIEYALLDTPIEIGTASGTRIEAIAEGAMTLKVAIGATVRMVTLTGLLHVPRLAGSLVSVIQLQDRGIMVRSTTREAENKLILEVGEVTIGEVSRIGKSYALDSKVQQIGIADMALESTVQEAVVTENIAEGQTAKEREAMLWHRRFGHLSS